MMTGVQSLRTHVKGWVWWRSLVIPALRKQKQMSLGGLLSSQPIDKLQAQESSRLKKTQRDVTEQGLTSGVHIQVHVYTHGRCAGVKIIQVQLRSPLLRVSQYNEVANRWPPAVFLSFKSKWDREVQFNQEKKAQSSYFVRAIFNHSYSAVVFFANNPMEYSSTLVWRPSFPISYHM